MTDDTPERLPCRMCAEPIVTDADRCRHCGYEGVAGTPLKSLRRRYWISRVLCVGGVGIPLLFYYSWRIRRADKRHPAWRRPAMGESEVSSA